MPYTMNTNNVNNQEVATMETIKSTNTTQEVTTMKNEKCSERR